MNLSTVIIFAGPNGSGKTSFIDAAFTHVSDFPKYYICPDLLAKLHPEITDEKERYIAAMNEAQDLRYKAIKEGKSFVFETLATTPEKLTFLEDAKKAGFTIELIFITTKDPSINIERIKKRVSEGGHAVPQEKVIDRYYKSLSALNKLIDLSDSSLVIDNSTDKPIIVFIKNQDHGMLLLNRELRNDWVKKYISEPFSSKKIKDLSVKETEIFIKELNSEVVSIMSRLHELRQISKKINIPSCKKDYKKER